MPFYRWMVFPGIYGKNTKFITVGPEYTAEHVVQCLVHTAINIAVIMVNLVILPKDLIAVNYQY
jgi:hypothetical protein